MKTIQFNNKSLYLSSEGLILAEQLIDAIDNKSKITVDFSTVERMTPSFCNAFLMTLLEQTQEDLNLIRKYCEFSNRNNHIIDSMNNSVQRYQSGIRLTTQSDSFEVVTT